ncbi:hypothetical protein [Profundibacter amoris]|uniref:Uncharacterized protein n=1 Tax=Profundibacter amoris TaxID=2171755 RepID=A0A347UDQ3_9RHOB|nr:hypothetical protein [Profundibacter amoris]AXX96981.1 hypothetical protein BAR1_02970 [Profundibacter amoris]
MNEDGNKTVFSLGEYIIGGANVEITLGEFNDLRQSRDIIRALRDIEDLFALVVTAFTELEKFLLSSSVVYLTDPFVEENDMERFFDRFRDTLNLHLLSLFTAARAYEEQTCQRIKEIYKANSEFKYNPKPDFSFSFDNSFEYRVMYGLRNHCLHAQLPIDGFTFGRSGQWQDGTPTWNKPSRSRITINPYFSAREIIESRINKKVRDEVEKLDLGKLDMKYLLRNYIAQLSIIHGKIRSKTENVLGEALKKLFAAQEKLSSEENNEEIRNLSLWKQVNGKLIDRIYIEPSRLDRVVTLRKRWTSLNYINRAYISSETILIKDTYPNDGADVYITK